MQQRDNPSSQAMGLLVYVASKSGERKKYVRYGYTEIEVAIASSRLQNILDVKLCMGVLFNRIMLVNISQDNLNHVPHHYSTS